MSVAPYRDTKEVEYETVRLPELNDPRWKAKSMKDFLDALVEDQNHEVKRKMANRYNEGKIQWDLVDWTALEPMVQGLMYGAKKYSRHQWKKGLNMDEIMASLCRHAFAIMEGEYIDKESGVPHVGLLMCNAMFWSHFYQKNLNQNGDSLADIGTE